MEKNRIRRSKIDPINNIHSNTMILFLSDKKPIDYLL